MARFAVVLGVTMLLGLCESSVAVGDSDPGSQSQSEKQQAAVTSPLFVIGVMKSGTTALYVS